MNLRVRDLIVINIVIILFWIFFSPITVRKTSWAANLSNFWNQSGIFELWYRNQDIICFNILSFISFILFCFEDAIAEHQWLWLFDCFDFCCWSLFSIYLLPLFFLEFIILPSKLLFVNNVKETLKIKFILIISINSIFIFIINQVLLKITNFTQNLAAQNFFKECRGTCSNNHDSSIFISRRLSLIIFEKCILNRMQDSINLLKSTFKGRKLILYKIKLNCCFIIFLSI